MRISLSVLLLIGIIFASSGCDKAPQKPSKTFVTPPSEAKSQVKIPAKGALNVFQGDEPWVFEIKSGKEAGRIELKYGFSPAILHSELKDFTGDGKPELSLDMEYTDPVHTKRKVVFAEPFSEHPHIVFAADWYRASEPGNNFVVDYSGGRKSFLCRGRIWGRDGRMVIYAWNEIQGRFLLNDKRHFGQIAVRETGNDGTSGFFYELQDRVGNPFILPKEIENSIQESPFTSVSPDEKFLVWQDGIGIMLLDLLSGKSKEIMQLEKGADGISQSLWTNESDRLAFVAINQNQYVNNTQAIVLDIQKGQLAKKQKFDLPIQFECGGICTATAGVDFWFGSRTNLQYKVHENVKTDLRTGSVNLE